MSEPQWNFYGFSVVAVSLFFRTLYGLDVRGREYLPRTGGMILAANHQSYGDPPIVAAAVVPRHVTFLAKQELFAREPFATLIRSLGAFPVDRSRGDTQALKNALRLLEQGRPLLVFPEGGRNLDGSLEVKHGTAFLARLSGVPVIPTGISGTASLRFRKSIGVRFGEPMVYERSLGKSHAAMATWTTTLMQRIEDLRGHADP